MTPCFVISPRGKIHRMESTDTTVCNIVLTDGVRQYGARRLNRCPKCERVNELRLAIANESRRRSTARERAEVSAIINRHGRDKEE